ncbi:four-helix bundle copper-binding protein [Niallia sp. XMNu-256]|uniref:four-helix bundle copper-binding protein n=1 Tax=Niallia sp. XMNu-256 TaxID=3082444 RepID=UPI0030D2D3F7
MVTKNSVKMTETAPPSGNTYAIGDQLNTYLKECLDACNLCIQACNECFDLCCTSPKEEYANCLKILRDCSDICALVSQMISRNSVNAKLISSFCANICDACAKACEKFDDPIWRKCAEICRQCADACREACCS